MTDQWSRNSEGRVVRTVIDENGHTQVHTLDYDFYEYCYLCGRSLLECQFQHEHEMMKGLK